MLFRSVGFVNFFNYRDSKMILNFCRCTRYWYVIFYSRKENASHKGKEREEGKDGTVLKVFKERDRASTPNCSTKHVVVKLVPPSLNLYDDR